MAKRRAGWALTARLGAAMLGAAALVPGVAGAQGAGAEWTTPAGTLQGTRYSTLTDITPANVAGLVEEFSVPSGLHGSQEGQPVVAGTTMYVVTPFPNSLIAIDLANAGAVKWTFTPPVNEYARGVACCDTVNRGASYASGKVVFTLLDDGVVAVDAVTGAQVWRTSMGEPLTGMTMSGAPLIVGDKVIVGNSGGELGIRGWVAALDLATGHEVWRAYSTGPDTDVKIGPDFHAFYPKDQGANLGVTTWPANNMWQQGGGTVWSWLTYDPALKLLFHGTSNPGVWNPDLRPGDNKWATSVFARNPDTGAAVWAYQVTPHDNWDFDATNEYIAVDLPWAGKANRQLLVHFDKNGYAYTMDRKTGKVLLAKPFIAENWSLKVDLTTGAPLFQAQLECGIGANPISFTGADGKQRIAVYTGTGWIAGGMSGGSCPNGAWDNNHAGPPPGPTTTSTATSGAVHVFKLP